jgi:hypothetical protein
VERRLGSVVLLALLVILAAFSSCATRIGDELYASDSWRKYNAMNEVQRIYQFARFHRAAIARIAGFLEEAEHNYDAVVLAAELAASRGTNTGAYVDIAQYASQSGEYTPEFTELLREVARSTSGEGALVEVARQISLRE